MLKRVRRRVQEDGPTAELEAFLASQGYIQLRVIGTAVCGLHRFSFTTGLVVGLNFEGYERRYTPAHVLGGWRRRIEARQACEPEPQRTDTVSPAVPHPARAHRSDARPERRPVVRQASQPKVAAQLRLFDD